jgi:hypothetical protein
VTALPATCNINKSGRHRLRSIFRSGASLVNDLLRLGIRYMLGRDGRKGNFLMVSLGREIIRTLDGGNAVDHNETEVVGQNERGSSITSWPAEACSCA